MKTVIEMALEAGFEVHERKQQARVGLDALCGIDSTAKLERFAELVRADERDRLATKLVQDFKGAFGDDTCASWAVWIKEQK